MLRPMPWPTSDRTIEKPLASTCDCTACETSPSRLPDRHCSTARNSASSVTASSRAATGEISPTANVRAASATQPSFTTPMSTDRTSPREA
jgi:hypothetical protein